MPKKNIVKQYGADEYYHVYNRGVARMEIFREEVDYAFMLSLFKLYLTPGITTDRKGREIQNLSDEVDLVAFCLMPNHYHLMFYLKGRDGIMKLMRSVMTAYSMYFNRKYKRTGTLFEGGFLASRITSDTYFWQVSRYIHLNPIDIGKDFEHYDFSSLPYFLGTWQAEWVHPEYVVSTEEDRQIYREELVANEEWHEECHRLKHILAGTDS